MGSAVYYPPRRDKMYVEINKEKMDRAYTNMVHQLFLEICMDFKDNYTLTDRQMRYLCDFAKSYMEEY